MAMKSCDLEYDVLSWIFFPTDIPSSIFSTQLGLWYVLVDQTEVDLAALDFPPLLSLVPGLPTVQLLITCSMQNGEGRPGPFLLHG